MKLRKGLKLTIGHKTWTVEIPERTLEEMSKDWPKGKIEDFRKNYGDVARVDSKPVKKDK